mgnify:CR=1 FL=1
MPDGALLVVGTKSFCRRARDLFSKIGIPVATLEALEEDIDYEDVTDALLQMDGFDWGVFTSVNAVRVLSETAQRLGLERPLDRLKWAAAVGPSTAKALAGLWKGEVFIPSSYTTEVLAEQLPNVEGSSIIAFRSGQADERLDSILLRRGARRVVRVSAYSVRIRVDADVPSEHSLVVLGAPSSARAYHLLCRSRGLETRPAICIGPVTGNVATKLRIAVVGVAEEHSLEGVVRKALEVIGNA